MGAYSRFYRAMVIDEAFFLNLPGQRATAFSTLNQVGIREEVFSALVLVRIPQDSDLPDQFLGYSRKPLCFTICYALEPITLSSLFSVPHLLNNFASIEKRSRALPIV